jgi:hypothetical protein
MQVPIPEALRRRGVASTYIPTATATATIRSHANAARRTNPPAKVTPLLPCHASHTIRPPTAVPCAAHVAYDIAPEPPTPMPQKPGSDQSIGRCLTGVPPHGALPPKESPISPAEKRTHKLYVPLRPPASAYATELRVWASPCPSPSAPANQSVDMRHTSLQQITVRTPHYGGADPELRRDLFVYMAVLGLGDLSRWRLCVITTEIAR